MLDAELKTTPALTTLPPQFIPFAKPSIGEEEIQAVANALRSGWLTTGPVTKTFEQDFAEFISAPMSSRSTPRRRACIWRSRRSAFSQATRC